MKLTDLQSKTLQSFQIASAGTDNKVPTEGMLLLAKYTKKALAGNSIRLVLDWKGLGISNAKEKAEAWETVAEKVRVKYPKLGKLTARSISLEWLNKFSSITDEASQIIDTTPSVLDAIDKVYKELGIIIHRASITSGNISEAESKASKYQPMLDFLAKYWDTLSVEELEAYSKEVALVLNKKRRQDSWFELPKEYTLPKLPDSLDPVQLAETPVSVLMMNGFEQTEYDHLEDTAILVKGEASVVIANALPKSKEAWKNLSAEVKTKIMVTLEETQPFYVNKDKKTWNYKNIAIHVFNQHNVLVSPQVLQLLALFRDNKPSD